MRELAEADRIETLEAKIEYLKAADTRNNEELVRLKGIIWALHANESGRRLNCECDVCTEVEQSRAELQGMV